MQGNATDAAVFIGLESDRGVHDLPEELSIGSWIHRKFCLSCCLNEKL